MSDVLKNPRKALAEAVLGSALSVLNRSAESVRELDTIIFESPDPLADIRAQLGTHRKAIFTLAALGAWALCAKKSLSRPGPAVADEPLIVSHTCPVSGIVHTQQVQPGEENGVPPNSEGMDPVDFECGA